MAMTWDDDGYCCADWCGRCKMHTSRGHAHIDEYWALEEEADEQGD